MNAAPRKKAVSYLRVSTQKQAQSGLGREAQREAVRGYIAGTTMQLGKEFIETESGKHDDRPQLAAALHLCKVTGAVLVIAKLDRLSRNVGFIDRLQESNVKFVCCDMPEADRTMIGIMAVLAQHERKAISQRTTVALQAAKARGVKLGNPNGARALRKAGKGNKAAVKIVKANADSFAADVKPIIEDIQASGMNTFEAIANELNARGILTVRGGRWFPATVQRLVQR